MVDYKTRLLKSMTDAKVHPQVLADHLGTSLQSVRKVLSGGSAAFNVANHFEACKFLKIDPVWLATGVSEETVAGTNRAESELLELFRSMEAPAREGMLAMLRGQVGEKGIPKSGESSSSRGSNGQSRKAA